MRKERMDFNAVKTFVATTGPFRARLGEDVTNWLAARRGIRIVDYIVTQSSDDGFHCLTITLFYFEDVAAAALRAA